MSKGHFLCARITMNQLSGLDLGWKTLKAQEHRLKSSEAFAHSCRCGPAHIYVCVNICMCIYFTSTYLCVYVRQWAHSIFYTYLYSHSTTTLIHFCSESQYKYDKWDLPLRVNSLCQDDLSALGLRFKSQHLALFCFAELQPSRFSWEFIACDVFFLIMMSS